MVAGRIRRGGRRKTLRAIEYRACANWSFAASFIGLYAHTKPVRKAKMGTPMRPWKGMRKMGSCSRRAPGASPESLG
jgi:hypothetical protein